MPQSFVKDPAATLDYVFDWSDWLVDDDAIASHTVTADTGITVASSTATTTHVTVWLSGGTAGTWYTVQCRITTSGGRTDDRTISIRVMEQ